MASGFPLIVMFPVGTLEAMSRELLQNILFPVGQQACKPRYLPHFPILSLISLHLKQSLMKNVVPRQPYECYMDCCKHFPLREESQILSWGNLRLLLYSV